MTTLLVLMIWVYLLLIARRMDPRPEDKEDRARSPRAQGSWASSRPHSKWPSVSSHSPSCRWFWRPVFGGG
jgi:hypothetical protein